MMFSPSMKIFPAEGSINRLIIFIVVVFSAYRRPDKADKFAFCNLKIYVVHGFFAALYVFETFSNVSKHRTSKIKFIQFVQFKFNFSDN